MKWLVTGGCGFIGANAVARLHGLGHEVAVLDDLSRRGSGTNESWLRDNQRWVGRMARRSVASERWVDDEVWAVRPDVILHLAGQTAVTHSVADPRRDFEVNAIGTLNVLEAARRHAPEAVVIYASTNKVYGDIRDDDWQQDDYELRWDLIKEHGINEEWGLDPATPYGCSKACADQYCLDYARTYGLKTVVLRQSAIYGPRQFAMTDQGWVARFCIAKELGLPCAIFGDGSQVRDVLHVDDLIDCYLACVARIDQAKGLAFNIGGGRDNTLSVQGLADRLGLECAVGPWRPSDQRVYVSDVRKAERLLGWRPTIGVEAGLESLRRWVREERDALAALEGLTGIVP